MSELPFLLVTGPWKTKGPLACRDIWVVSSTCELHKGQGRALSRERDSCPLHHFLGTKRILPMHMYALTHTPVHIHIFIPTHPLTSHTHTPIFTPPTLTHTYTHTYIQTTHIILTHSQVQASLVSKGQPSPETPSSPCALMWTIFTAP